MNHFSHPSALRLTAATSWLTALLLSALPASAFIPEPETLIYGRILNRHGGQSEQLITSGKLVWKIKKADGTEIALSGEISELAGGASYLLRVPHQAIALGQTQSARVVPLGIAKSNASHVQISVDQFPARILSPGTSSLDLEQALRASAYRLDLEVVMPEIDTDGDGIPDWWEDENGLDKQNPNDGLLDSDGDGISNINEYKNGTDPQKGSTLPDLITTEVIAYGSSKSIVLLETKDTDTPAAQLIYTVDALPAGGRLSLRSPERLLTLGATFTQADVNAGRLIIDHTDSAEIGIIGVSVRDENPEHAADTGEVRALLFNPPAQTVGIDGAEIFRLRALQLAKTGHLIADLSATSGSHRLSAPSASVSALNYAAWVQTSGEEKAHVFMGGPSDDTFTGGYGADLISGGRGNDSLTGGAAADTFIYTDISDGNDTITDFKSLDQDAIDLSAVLKGTSKNLYDYVRIETSGSDAILGVSALGTATGYSDLKIRLKNSSLKQSDLAALYYGGNLITGEAGLAPRISVIASANKASENGPVASYFTVSREGSLADAITANFTFSGSAINGIDFRFVETSVVIPAGVTNVSVPILPIADNRSEPGQIVTISLSGGSNYLLGTIRADLAIEDLKPQLWMEVVDSIASVKDGLNASFILHRGGSLNETPAAQLTFSGTAVKNTDYKSIATTHIFAPNETAKIIEIQPLPGANFGTAEGKTLNISVTSKSDYVSQPTPERFVIVPELLTYSKWNNANLTRGVAPSDSSMSDPGGHGLKMLLRYAFSLDSQNPYGTASIDRMPRPELINGHLALKFRRNPGITDVDYEVQYSNDLIEWKTGPEFVEDISLQQSPNDPSTVVFRSKKPMAQETKASMRVVTKEKNQ